MEQIVDYKEWIASEKQTDRKWLTNLYLMPDQLQMLAEEKRLYGQKLPAGGFVLLVDEGEYDSLHFKVKSLEEFSFDKREKPVLAEIVYRESKQQEIQVLEDLLAANGFEIRARFVQFIKNLPKEESSWAEEKQHDEYKIARGTLADKEVILKLWQELLEPYDFQDFCKEKLDEYLLDGKIFCAKDISGIVRGACLFEQHGKRYSYRHLVVDSAHQGKRLGSALLRYCEAYGIHRGCRSAAEWVALDNYSSLAINRRQMQESDKKMVQYVLE